LPGRERPSRARAARPFHPSPLTPHPCDAELGLYNYRAREYDPGAGRFLGEDPIGFGAGDANLYRYTGNGPTNATDALGLQAGKNDKRIKEIEKRLLVLTGKYEAVGERYVRLDNEYARLRKEYKSTFFLRFIKRQRILNKLEVVVKELKVTVEELEKIVKEYRELDSELAKLQKK
jgi:RHS repeat-associated protein